MSLTCGWDKGYKKYTDFLLLGNLLETVQLEDQGKDGRIVLR
jgi:hypothetical protein